LIVNCANQFTRVLVAFFFFALALATLRPLWGQDGWPDNHEGNLFLLRTHIYARHFSWLDLMPIWSSADVSGFGSPLPLLYHKLFYFLAGALALITGSVKSADVTAIALLLVTGASGTALTLRSLGASRLTAVIGGCCLITANYTVTNWLVRGALAEFTSAMIVPWVLFFFVRAISTGRISAGLGVTLGLLWLSHSVLAYFTGLILAVTFLAMAAFRLTSWSALHPRTAWPAFAWFALLVTPYLVLMLVLGRDYDITRIVTPPFQPEYQFRPFLAYLWDDRWRFGDRSANLTVQLDAALVALLAASVIALLMQRPDAESRRSETVVPVVPFLLVMAVGLFLQLPASAALYRWMPGALFIQFPWRLLAVITPSLVVSALFMADRALPPAARPFALGAALAWTLAVCGAFAPLRYGRVPVAPDLRTVSFSGFREYEPRTASPLAQSRAAIGEWWSASGCSYAVGDPGNDETAVVTFQISCGRSALLPLPIYASPLHAVGSSTHGRHQPCFDLPDFPGVCGAVVPPGDSVISVKLPTVRSFISWAWRQITP
jgi:hypothetical protein